MADHDKLYYTVQLEMKELRKQVSQFESELAKMRGETEKTTNLMGQNFAKLGKLFKGYLTVDTIKNFVTKVIEVRGEMQSLEASFKTMLGSQEKATILMQQLTETAAKTPFDMQSVAQGAKQLLAYGTSAENVNETLVRLGDIASGLSIPLNDLVYLYGTTQTQGRVFTQDIKQFMGRGIPIIEELSKVLNVSTQDINDMVIAGKIGFPEIQKVIENLTNEGGKFNNLMEETSKTLKGQVSNLGDSIDKMFNEIGQAHEGTLSDAVSLVSSLVDNYKDIARVIGVLVATYGAYNAAVKVNVALQKAGGMASAVQRIVDMTRALKTAEGAQKLFNLAVAKNPYVMVATLLVGVISSLILFNNETRKQEKGLRNAQDALREISDTTREYKSNIEGLTGALRDNSKSINERMLAYLQLEKSTKGLFDFSGKQIKLPSADEMMGMTQDDFDKMVLRIEYAKKWTETIRKHNEAAQAGAKDKSVRAEKFAEANELKNELDNIKKQYNEQIRLREQAIEKGKVLEVKNKKYYEDLLKQENELWEKLTAEEREAYRATYEEKVKGFQEAIKGWEITEKKTDEAVEKQKEYNEALTEYKRILSDLSMVGLSGFSAEIAQANARLDETLTRLNALKAKGIDTTEGEIKAKSQHKEDIAEIEKRKSEEIVKIYEKMNEQLRTQEENRINDLYEEYNDLIKEVAKNFGDAEASPLVEQLIKARDVSVESAKAQAVSANETAKLEIKKIDLQADYNNGLMTEKEYSDNILQTEIEIAEIKLAELEAQAKLIENEDTLLEVEKQRANLRLLQSEKEKKEEQQKQTGIFSNAEDADEKMMQRIQGVTDVLSSLTSSLSEIEGELGDIFSAISEGANYLSNSISAISSGDKMAMIQNAAQGTSDLIAMAVKSVQEGKKAREEWRQQEIEANRELVKLRLEAFNYEENMFGDVGKEDHLISLIEKKNETQKALFDEIKRIEDEGQVKIGTKKVIDADKLVKATLVGMGAGASVGTMIFPGIGTAIGTAAGALTGALVGIFSKKSVNVYDSVLSKYGEIIDEKTLTLNEKLLADYDKLDDATKAMVDNAKELLETYKETKKEYEEQISEMYGNVRQELAQSLADSFRDGKVYDAIDDFRDYLQTKVSEVLQAKAFEAFFGGAMDGVEEIAKSGMMDQEQIAIEIAKIQNVLTSERLNSYSALMDAYDKAINEAFGMSIKGVEEAQQEAMSGAISSMTEDTASALNANFMGLKLSAQEINSKVASISDNIPIVNDLLSRGVEYQRRTADNTDVMVEELRTIRRDGVIMR